MSVCKKEPLYQMSFYCGRQISVKPNKKISLKAVKKSSMKQRILLTGFKHPPEDGAVRLAARTIKPLNERQRRRRKELPQYKSKDGEGNWVVKIRRLSNVKRRLS